MADSSASGLRWGGMGGALLVVTAVAVGQWSGGRPISGQRGGDEGGTAAAIGPDVIVGALTDIASYGTVNGISAYAVGTTSCNIGDMVLAWYSNTNQHPVIAQNLYRLRDGRFEMVGMSWLKHGFCALSGTLCGPCQSTPCSTLGIGCSDPYSASLNGSVSYLGPRSQVNPTSGLFPYPFSAPPAAATIGRRLQVAIGDLAPSANPGALYFAEGHYITPDEPSYRTDLNNASYRQAVVGSLGSNGAWNLSMTGPTFQQKPAIFAWREHGLGIGQPDPQVEIRAIDGGGRVYVAFKARPLGDGWWRYEYAVQNYNAHRGVGEFIVPVPEGVQVANVGFRGPGHHSGEPYSTSPWEVVHADGEIRWSTEPHAANPNANALRWGTLFNFRFDAASPPVAAIGSLTYFTPGTPSGASIGLVGPESVAVFGDLDGNGIVDGADLAILLSAWGDAGGPADLDGDGVVGGSDLGLLLGAWG